MTSIQDGGSCWGLFEVWKRKPFSETCEHTLFDFSPSGDRILAGPAYLDGFGQGSAAVLDGDGRVLSEWHSHGRAAILQTIWEDDDHVLALVCEDGAWAVLRLGVDASVDRRPARGGPGRRRNCNLPRPRRVLVENLSPGRMSRDRRSHRRPGEDDV